MTYEETSIKKGKGLGKSVAIKATETLGTGTILWLLVKRHKVGLLGTWAVIITVLYIFPPLPDMVLSLLGK